MAGSRPSPASPAPEKPDIDEILGRAPPIAIRRKNTTRNPRSTVANFTELYDSSFLFARVDRTYRPPCGNRFERDTVGQVAQTMLRQLEGSRRASPFSPVFIPHRGNPP